ncbi:MULTISPECIES: GNAT family N-acetyltransferase [Mumia]|uniref:GNAT family N-acetyltransferase n=1 Tax=Mumia TaxID=1546255 RepID=UPI001423C066|nr:GNAT family N-acetyltransferase [Mumia sp. ZJ430]
MTGDWHFEPLASRHDVSAFTCREHSIADWLKRYALPNQARRSSRTFVLVDGDDPAVIGYYALSLASLQKSTAAAEVAEGMPPFEIPGVLLGRMGRDEKYAYKHVGDLLLADAVLRTLQIAELAGAKVLLVHALRDELVTWYRDRGFLPSPVEGRLLMLPIQDLEATRDYA